MQSAFTAHTTQVEANQNKTTTNPKKNMALKRIQSEVKETAKSTKDIAVVRVNNDIARYVKARQDLEDAQAIVDQLEPTLKAAGCREIFNHNTEDPTTPWSSVKLQDNNDAMVRVSFTAKYSAANADAVEAAFETIRTVDGEEVDVNNYVQETLKASFDSDVFLKKTKVVDESGKEITVSEFDQNRFDTFNAVIAAAAEKLGVANPLSAKRIVTARPEFHNLRWSRFDAAAQATIQKALPAVVSMSHKVKA